MKAEHIFATGGFVPLCVFFWWEGSGAMGGLGVFFRISVVLFMEEILLTTGGYSFYHYLMTNQIELKLQFIN